MVRKRVRWYAQLTAEEHAYRSMVVGEDPSSEEDDNPMDLAEELVATGLEVVAAGGDTVGDGTTYWGCTTGHLRHVGRNQVNLL